MRSSGRLAVAAVACATFLATATPVAAKTVDPEQWSRSFCTALTRWGSDVDRIRDDVDDAIAQAESERELEDAREALTGAMQGFRRATKRAGKRIDRAGEPDVPNGAAISERLVDAFDELDGFLADAIEEIDALPIDDVDAFQDGAADIQRGLGRGDRTISDAFDDVEQLDEDLELSDALEGVSACDSISGG